MYQPYTYGQRHHSCQRCPLLQGCGWVPKGPPEKQSVVIANLQNKTHFIQAEDEALTLQTRQEHIHTLTERSGYKLNDVRLRITSRHWGQLYLHVTVMQDHKQISVLFFYSVSEQNTAMWSSTFCDKPWIHVAHCHRWRAIRNTVRWTQCRTGWGSSGCEH